VALAALVTAGIIIYFGASLVSGAMRIGEIRAALKR
jgi:hypothetical protein